MISQTGRRKEEMEEIFREWHRKHMEARMRENKQRNVKHFRDRDASEVEGGRGRGLGRESRRGLKVEGE